MEIEHQEPDSSDAIPEGDGAASAGPDGGTPPSDLRIEVFPGGFKLRPNGTYEWEPRDVTDDPDWERLFDAERG